jgi:peptide/nickel transport system substrate-binding protein
VIVKDGTTVSPPPSAPALPVQGIHARRAHDRVRNPNYWKPGLPYLDEIVLFGIPDESARVNALLSGDVDWINDVNPRSAKRVREEPAFTAAGSQSGLYTDLVIRKDLGPRTPSRLRAGMKYLIDREQIKRAAFRGYAVTSATTSRSRRATASISPACRSAPTIRNARASTSSAPVRST